MSKRKSGAVEEVEGEGKKGFKDKDEDEDDGGVMCAICQDPIGSVNCCTTACNHQFNLSCMFKARRVKNSCPMCREQLETDLPMIPNQDEEEEGDEDDENDNNDMRKMRKK